MFSFFTVLLIILNSLTAVLMVFVADTYINFKHKSRGTERVDCFLYGKFALTAFMFGIITGIVFSLYLPMNKAIFACILFQFAVLGIIVDHSMRIIGNEMLLIMLIFGLLYKIVSGKPVEFVLSFVSVLAAALLFSVSSLISIGLRGVRGVGMGDIKLAMVSAFIVGIEGLPYFIPGMAVGMLVYVAYYYFKYLIVLNMSMAKNLAFPMCAPIMCGLIVGFIYTDIAKEFLFLPTLFGL